MDPFNGGVPNTWAHPAFGVVFPITVHVNNATQPLADGYRSPLLSVPNMGNRSDSHEVLQSWYIFVPAHHFPRSNPHHVISEAEFSRATVNSLHQNSTKAPGNSVWPVQILAYSLKIPKTATSLPCHWRGSCAPQGYPVFPSSTMEIKQLSCTPAFQKPPV